MSQFDAKKVKQRIIEVLVYTNQLPDKYFAGQVSYDSDFEKMLLDPELHISKLDLHCLISEIVTYFKEVV
jgi:hypothetical protein